jgi:mannose-6-phosphate isomerase-like protein (cupin superfamily)
MNDGFPQYFASGEGKSYQLGRITLTFKTSAIDTGGACTLCEAVEPPNSGAGLHRHVSYDETHIICEGRYEARLGNETLRLSVGDMFFAPRGTPHSINARWP